MEYRNLGTRRVRAVRRYWLRKTPLRIDGARLAVRTKDTAPTGLSLKVGAGTVSGFTGDDSLSGLYSKVTQALGTTVPNSATIAVKGAGALAPAAGAGTGAVDERLLEDLLLVLELRAT